MAGYTRQSTFADGDTITAALFNNEYNQLFNAFNNTGGHKHDGTAAEGPVIGLIGDAGETSPNNKVLIDTTNNFIEFYVQVSSSSVQQLYIADGAIIPVTDSDVDLGTSSLYFKNAYIDSITTTGNVAVGGNLTVTGTTTFNGGTITMGDAATDNVVFGADVDSNIIPDDDNTYDLGSSTQEWRNLYIDGTAHIDTLDVDANATVAGTLGVTGVLTGTSLDISGDIDVDGTTNLDVVDIDGAVDMATTLTVAGNVDFNGDLDVDGTTNLDVVDIDGAVDMASTLTLAGNADFNGDLDVDGTTNLDVVDIDGAVDMATTLTVGGEIAAASLDISGNVDIDGTLETDALSINSTTVTSTAAELNILDGVTSTAAELNILDGVTSTTAELNILDGVTATATEINLLDGVTSTTAELNILDGVTATAAEINTLDGITSTVAELNILDGVTASATDINLIDGITNGTVIASKAIITDSNKDITGGRNITISGELDAATLDISGNADIDGTLEADAITIGGVTLAETISDTVGAMVSSNTETNITVTYDDTDNTLDFVIGTLNQDTTGLAATATALATARTIHGVSFDGTANIDLTEVVQDTVGAMVSSNTESGITVAYQDGDGTLDFTVGTLNQDTTGSAATLTTARTIGGVSFDGSANINLPGVNAAGNQNTTGNAATATLAATTTVTDSTANTNFPIVFHNESNGLLDDTGALRYNPSTGELLVPKLTVAGTTTQVDTVTMEASNAIIFEGATADAHETTLSVIDPTADRTISLPNATGTLSLITGTETLTNKTLTAPTLTGTTVVASLDISGDIDVDGTTNLDVVDIDGAVDMASTLNVSGAITGTLGTAAQPNITSLGTLSSLVIDDITINGSNITDSGDIYIDVGGDIHLDADGADIRLKDAGLEWGRLVNNSSNFLLLAPVADKDIMFNGVDGSSEITALYLDMSDAGTAIFNHDIKLGDSGQAIFGADSDLSIYHDNSAGNIVNGTGVLNITNDDIRLKTSGAETMLRAIANGAVKLMYNNSTKLETINTGVTVTGNIGIGTTPSFGAGGGLEIERSGTCTIRLEDTSNKAAEIRMADDFEIISMNSGSDIVLDASNDIVLDADGGDILFKDGGTSLGSISMANTDITLTASADDLILTAADNIHLICQGNEAGIDITGNAGVTLYYNNGSRLETTNGGVDISGTLTTSGLLTVNDGAIFNEGSDDKDFRVESNNSTHMFFIDGGNDRVGINSSNPSTTLDVSGDVLFGTGNRFTTATNVFKSTASGENGASIRSAVSSAANPTYSNVDDTNTGMFFPAADHLAFSAGGNEVCRLDSSEYFFVGQSDKTSSVTNGGVYIAGDVNVGSTNRYAQMFIQHNSSVNHGIAFKELRTAGGTQMEFINSSGSIVGSVTHNASATSYVTSSDYRLKENVDYTWNATTRLKQLKPARFNFIADETNTLVDGFLAHEVSSIVPEAITGEKDAVDSEGNSDYQGIDQSKLVPLLVKTIQELEARITALES